MTSRRNFLKGSLAVATLAPGVTLFSMGEANAQVTGPASSKNRWGMLIDAAKCTDNCTDCVSACSSANGWKMNTPDTDPRTAATEPQWIRKVSVKNPKNGFSFSAPVMCQHCANPPCVDVCPTGASFKRVDGIVLVDRHICIGCRYCMMACPYKARSFVHEEVHDQKPDVPRGQGTVEACTLCVKRVDEGKKPYCVEACKNGAMLFGDLNDPNSDIAKAVASYKTTHIRADLGCDPGVYYQNIS
jgi:molybdopterin-containing oxidoreductase family iron-sulfur binding subunit